jgi:manganese oxidase
MTGCSGGGSSTPTNPATTYSISGRITLTQGGSGLAAVSVALGGASADTQPTDSSGNYTFTGLKSGDYTISPSKAGYSFGPVSRALSNISTNMPGNDFNATAAATNARNYMLYIVPGNFTINGNGGASMAAWGYTDVAGGAPKFPAPTLIANPGDVVTVTVINNHNIDHNFLIKGVTGDMTAIAPNQRRTYTFTALDASSGSHIYYDTLNNTVNREMGLYGAMIIKPTDGTSKMVWTGGPAYTLDYTWVIGEMDKSHWNDVAGTGVTPDASAYEPDYYFINGKGGFDAQQDPNTTITGKVGDTVLVRIINGGQFPYSMHFHANHVKVVALDGAAQTAPFKQLDVVSVPPLGTADLLYDLAQSGEYLMHVHTPQAEASGGVYLNGMMAMIHIQ